MIIAIALLCCSFLTSTVSAQYASTVPAPIPLFHKTPYLNAWLPAPGNASIYIQGQPPLSMPNKLFVDLVIAVRVDGTAYLLQGELQSTFRVAQTIGAYITSTRTILTMDAGPVRVNITYLTPVEVSRKFLSPTEYQAEGLDGNPHTIQLYSDLGGTFLSSDRDNKMTWNTTTISKTTYHQAQQSIIQTLVENDNMAEDGTQYFATSEAPGIVLTWQSATYDITRGGFASTGNLPKTSDTKFRSIRNGWTTMAFALDFGPTTGIFSKPVFAIGLVRDPVMMYAKDGKTQSRSSLWWSRWKNVGQAIDAFLVDYPSALLRATALDNKIASDATTMFSSIGLPPAVGVNLTDLVILSVRQTIGSLEFTTTKFPDGKLGGIDEWRVFMKDVGITRRVNPVDNLYASFPAFLYLNSSLAGKLLEPLLELQVSALSGNTTPVYAAPDLGSNWPLVIGNNKDQYFFGVESNVSFHCGCGSMLVMALAQARKSGDGFLIQKYYDLLHRWAEFLVENALQSNEYTTSTESVTNTTSNLALKGILGIYAMGHINRALQRDSTYYVDTASAYVQKWRTLVLSSDHVMSQFGNTTSWGLLFNLYDPILLGANIIPQAIYETQASWYASQVQKAPPFGLPYDSSRPNVIKAPWALFTAASIFNTTNSSARDALIGMVHSKSFMKSAVVQMDANPSIYFADSGNTSTGIGNPAMGSMFAFLALNVSDMKIKIPSTKSSSPILGGVLGGVLGGIAALTLISISAYFLLRKLRKGTTTPEQEHRPTIEPERNAATHTLAPSMTEFNPYAEVMMAPAELPSNSPPPSYANDHTPFNTEKVLLAPNLNSFASARDFDQNASGSSARNGGT